MLGLLISIAHAWDPSPDEQALVRALAARDGAAPCEQLEALVPDAVHSLENVVAHVEMPPWAPMNAAACLIERHADERMDLLGSWVTEPGKKGLARLVFNRLQLLEPDRAIELVTKARTGPYRPDLQAALVRSPDATLRALAD